MDNLAMSYYLNLFLQLKRGNYKGIVSNAKPIMILAVIEAIQCGVCSDNKIEISNNLTYIYKDIYCKYDGRKPSPISYPYYHLENDKFWHLKWKKSPLKKDAPSMKFVNDNIEYAYLDDALWYLLQDETIRNNYKETILRFFLK